MQKISSPGFLADGFKFPTARLGKETSCLKESALLAFADQDISLMEQVIATKISRIAVVAMRILLFILSASSYVNLITESALVTIYGL